MDSTKSLLCVPCIVRSDVYPDDGYHIFFVNLSSKSSKGKAEGRDREYREEEVPKLRVSRNFKFRCFWVKGCTLFMFSSDKRVGTLDLAKLLRPGSSDVSLEEHMIKYRTPMNFPKSLPMVVPTLNGKLLVYSSLFQSQLIGVKTCVPSGVGRGVGRGDENYSVWGDKRDMEIYDADKDAWEELPPIQWFWPYNSFQVNCLVDWAVFKDEQTLLVRVLDEKDHKLQFELDMSEGVWKRIKSLGSSEMELRNITAVVVDGVDDQLFFSPYKVFDIKNERERDLIPSSLEDSNYLAESYLYESDDRSCFVSCDDRSCFVSCGGGGGGGGGGCCLYLVQARMIRNSSTTEMSVRTFSVSFSERNEIKQRVESYLEGDSSSGGLKIEIVERELERVESNLPQRDSRLSQGKLKLPIGVELINSFKFVINACTTLRPLSLGSLSLCRVPRVPAPQKQKRKRGSSIPEAKAAIAHIK